MFRRISITHAVFVMVAVPGLIVANINTVHAQILDENKLQSVGIQTLQEELAIFTTIQRGITLAVAECELLEVCNASVNRGEIEQLITTVDTRVNSLSLRYTETGDTGLETVLVGYADVRDSYRTLMDKMGTLPQFVAQQEIVDDIETDDFFAARPGRINGVSNDMMLLFQDADEDLVDDPLDDTTTPANNQ